MKQVLLSEILSITTRRALVPCSQFGMVLQYITGHPAHTLSLKRLRDSVLPYLYQWHPWLEECSQGWTKENWEQKLSDAIQTHGEKIEVYQIPSSSIMEMSMIEEMDFTYPDNSHKIVSI